MANVLKHRFASAKADGSDPTQIQPSYWNDGHAFSGGNAGDLLTRDPTDATYGAKWAAPPTPVVALPWTPVDATTAGLTFTVYGATYTRIGKFIAIWGYLSYPATANGLNAAIGGLPVVNGPQFAGCTQINSGAYIFHLPPNGTALQPVSASTGVSITNAQLSGAILIFQGMYLTP